MSNRTHALVAGLLVLCALGTAAMADDVDPDDFSHPTRRELNEARMDAGLVRSYVVYDRSSKAWRIVTDPSERGQQAMADALCAQIVAEVSRGPLVVEVSSVADALVVLRFNPAHEGAQAVLRARYTELRQAARAERSKRAPR